MWTGQISAFRKVPASALQEERPRLTGKSAHGTFAALRTVKLSFRRTFAACLAGRAGHAPTLLTSGGIVGTLSILLAFLSVANSVQADPISDVRSLSVFKDADLNKLAGGAVLASKGPAMSFGRGLAVESVYVVRMPVQKTVVLQQQWNPTPHRELRIYTQADVSGRPSPNDFRALASVPLNSSVKALAEATERLPGDAPKLQLSMAEA